MKATRKAMQPVAIARVGASVLLVLGSLLACPMVLAGTPTADDLFHQGTEAYVAGGFEQSAMLFRDAAAAARSAGTLHNLGNAEWQRGHPGPAIVAWERAQWLDPFSRDTRANLRFARKAAQLETPELSWYEICWTWLPVNAWGWLATVSFWTAAAMVLLPAVLRWRKADWQQGLATAGFAVFLLTLPALAGVQARSRLGILLPKETPLRLTPTREAQILAKLPSGEMARRERERGDYVFIRASGASGWVEKSQFGLIADE